MSNEFNTLFPFPIGGRNADDMGMPPQMTSAIKHIPADCTDAELSASFDMKYHASRNMAATKANVKSPCAICGWAFCMAIHDLRSRHVFGFGHEYLPIKPATSARLRQGGAVSP